MQSEQNAPPVLEATPQKTILLVEDNPIFRIIMVKTIADRTQHRVIQLPDGSEMMRVINESKPDMLILDYDLPGMNGIELYDLVHTTEGLEDIPALMVSANLPQNELAQRNIAGLYKPCRTSDLIAAIQKTLAS